MKKLESIESTGFLAVILGGNRGAYGLAQAFYEEYGIKSIVVSPYQTGPILHSMIIDYYSQSNIMNIEQLMSTFQQIEADFPNSKKLLFGSDDCYVELLINKREQFSNQWIVPYVEKETYKQVTDKSRFYDLCHQIGVPYPRTSIVKKAEQTFSLTFPVIIKPAQTPDFQILSFEGKQKVYICYDMQEASENISLIYQNGYQGELIVQEYIQGDDQSLGIVTAYVAKKDRKLKLVSFANVLVDDPTPSAIGNSLAGIVRKEPALMESIIKIVEASDFYGFATFDVKYDSDRGKYVFFELNGRLGSSNYYVTSAGNNVAKYYVDDFLLNQSIEGTNNEKEVLYTVLPKKLLLHMISNKEDKQKIKTFYQNKQVVRLLYASYEHHLKRKTYLMASALNYYKKLLLFPSLERKFLSNQEKHVFKSNLAQRLVKQTDTDSLFHKHNL